MGSLYIAYGIPKYFARSRIVSYNVMVKSGKMDANWADGWPSSSNNFAGRIPREKKVS
jgi:hypothetical protein